MDDTYATVRKFLTVFEENFGSTNCEELTGCDLGTEEGQQEFRERNVRERCKRYTEAATGLVLALIEERFQH